PPRPWCPRLARQTPPRRPAVAAPIWFSLTRRPPRSTLFPSTTLFRSNGAFHIGHIMEYIQADIWVRFQRMRGATVRFVGADEARSEEHTSELQPREKLVCRLPLEKKKQAVRSARTGAQGARSGYGSPR